VGTAQNPANPRVIVTHGAREFTGGHLEIVEPIAHTFPHAGLHVLPFRHSSRYHGFSRVAIANWWRQTGFHEKRSTSVKAKVFT
jgi:hypothetical protein